MSKKLDWESREKNLFPQIKSSMKKKHRIWNEAADFNGKEELTENSRGLEGRQQCGWTTMLKVEAGNRTSVRDIMWSNWMYLSDYYYYYQAVTFRAAVAVNKKDKKHVLKGEGKLEYFSLMFTLLFLVVDHFWLGFLL